VARQRPEISYAPSTGAKIALQVSGTGPPDLVMVPGFVRSGRPRPAVGRPSLTDAERPVLGLAAEGLTNREIADRLFLSRYTVETHLKHVFAKLGVRSAPSWPPWRSPQP